VVAGVEYQSKMFDLISLKVVIRIITFILRPLLLVMSAHPLLNLNLLPLNNVFDLTPPSSLTPIPQRARAKSLPPSSSPGPIAMSPLVGTREEHRPKVIQRQQRGESRVTCPRITMRVDLQTLCSTKRSLETWRHEG
jgi:hypothetical protein